MEQLKPREKKMLDFMRDEFKKKGYPPTVREICAALEIKSTSTVHKDIESLEKKGYLKKDPSKPRAISFSKTGKASGAGNAHQIAEEDSILSVPVVGNIAAGSPITATENIEEYFPVPKAYVKGDNFMLTVRGESMIDIGIFDGDKILVQEKKDVRNGDVVVALIQGGYEPEATVKTFYDEGETIRLQPENKEFTPIIEKKKDVEILGIVKGVFRYLN
ncbi:MAG: transcriptional repressor LexA [Clostridiales Family XIII bacterium]|jgi:repressor LexA|nr:transcriptional repressor LexA [Clostridiales Family XIII bacterium]